MRTRTHDEGWHQGLAGRLGSAPTVERYVHKGFSTVTDAGPGTYRDQAFGVYKKTVTGGLIHGGNWYCDFYDMPAYRYAGEPLVPVSDLSAPSDVELATKLLAGTNPSAPDIDILAFAYEFREIPEIFRLWGRRNGQAAASANLKYQFEIIPTISDFLKLLQFVQSVERRLKTLAKMQTFGNVKVRKTLWKGARETTTRVLANSDLACFVDVDEYVGINSKIWGYTTWYANGPLPTTPTSMANLAQRLVLGLSGPSFSTIWEILPWSWLIDWFSNVGDCLQAARNVVDAYPGPVCLCETRGAVVETVKVHGVSAGCTFTPYKMTVVTKERRPASASLTASVPLITDRQAGILGSLAILSRRR